MCQHQGKEIKALDESAKSYLEKNRWPPVWYLKDQDYYERFLRKAEKDSSFKISKQQNDTSCFSFFKIF